MLFFRLDTKNPRGPQPRGFFMGFADLEEAKASIAAHILIDARE